MTRIARRSSSERDDAPREFLKSAGGVALERRGAYSNFSPYGK